MNKSTKKKIYIALACILAVAGCLCGIFYPDSDWNDKIKDTQNIVENEIKSLEEDVIVSEFVQCEVVDTIQATIEGEDVSTTEVIESTIEEEKTLEDELEVDASVEQENISYDGDNSGKGLSLLGAYQGLTYYSQADSRWASILYTSTGNSTQTMKSSACGPTSAAMVVSSSKGAILPTAMAQLFVSNGYRTANNGTAWSAYSFVADYFDFDEYYYTSSIDTALNYLKQDKDNDGNTDYYVITSCGSGLFTTGGHYIVLVADKNGTITVYDPYLYGGKFNTASRRNAGVIVSGNSAYVSESAFKTYANAKGFFIYSNDSGSGTKISQYKQGQKVCIEQKVGVCCYSGEYALIDNGEKQFWINKSVIYNDNTIYGLGIVAWSEGSRCLVEILGVQYWTNSSNLNCNIPNYNKYEVLSPVKIPVSTYATGRYITTCNLNVRSGAGTQYKINKVYKKGTVFTALQINDKWAKTPSGWVCLDYAKKQ